MKRREVSLFRVILIIFVMFISACPHTREVEIVDRCNEDEKLADRWFSIINEIKNKTELTIEDTKTLIKPIGVGFENSWGPCNFTEQVRRATENVLSQRAEELTAPLLNLCRQPIPADDRDMLYVAMIIEQKKAAKKALEYLEQPTDLCSESSLDDDIWNSSLYITDRVMKKRGQLLP